MFECRQQPLRLPDDLVAALTAKYYEPHRAYHNVTHIDEVLGWFDRVHDDIGWHAKTEVYLAIVFHDAIYEPGAKDNEARSAAWARSAGLPANGDRVAELILMTASHGSHHGADHDAGLFLDSDMAIVGADADAFDDYNAAIAIEYGQVPRDAYRAGRRAFLAGLAARPRIFLTDYFHRLLDRQARANLARALAQM